MDLKTPLTDISVSRDQEQAIHALYLEKFEQFATALDRQVESQPIKAPVPIALEEIYGNLREALVDYKDYRLQYALAQDKSMPMRPLSPVAVAILQNTENLWDRNFGSLVVRRALDTVDRSIEDTLGLATGFEYRT